MADALGSQDLGFFQQLAYEFAAEHSMDMAEVAGALAFIAQQDSPLQVKGKGMPGHNNADDRGRRDRNDRGERGRDRDTGVKMQAYRIEVGREHGVSPRDIVGAIANEANISSKYIGNIKLCPTFSVVELPADMPADVQEALKKTKVRNQQLDIKVDPRGGQGVGRRDDRGGRGRRDDRGGRGRRDDRGGRSRGCEGHRGRRNDRDGNR